jgi:hypothetical protein
METAPILVPAPAIVEDKTKPVLIQPPEVSSAHDFAVIAFILTFLLTIPWLLLSLIIGGIGLAAYLGYAILPPVLPPSLTAIPYLGDFLLFLTFVLSPSYLIYMGLGGGGLLVILIFLFALYWGVVRNINKGRYQNARNAALFFGVLFIIPTFFVLFAPTQIFGVVVAIIPAFFLLMAYGRLGEAIAKYGPVAVLGEAAPGLPFAGGPAPVPPPPVAAMPPMGAPMGGPMGAPGAGPVPVPPGAVGPPMQPLTGVAPRVPLCPTCGRELYYSANHRRWYCMTCDNPMGTSGIRR